MALLDGRSLVCDSVFVTSRKLKSKINKLKETTLEDGEERMDKYQALIHVQQYAEWGNEFLTVVFRRICIKIPTNNLKYELLQ